MTPDERMHPRWWRSLFPKDEIEAYDLYRSPIVRVPRLGSAALLVVDATLEFLGGREPVLMAAAKIPTACGEWAWEAVGNIALLLAVFRDLGRPVIFTVPDWELQSTLGAATSGPDRAVDSRFGTMPPDIAPDGSEPVVKRSKPSAFFGTSLPSLLIRENVTDIVVAGGTTSGCIRATVVDASSFGFATTIVHDSCFDRSRLSHGVALFELERKHAAVLSTVDIEAVARSSR